MTGQFSRSISKGVLPESQRWSAQRLFDAGEVGVVFDPSDLGTLFLNDGTGGPVTTPGQIVGLILDKSKGLVLGTEVVGTLPTPTITNTAGSSGAWNAATQTMSNTALGTNSSYPRFVFNIPVVAGKVYAINGQLTTTTPNVVTLRLASGGFSSIANYNAVTGTFMGYATCTTSNHVEFQLNGTLAVPWSAQIVSLSLREVLGNHASQATSSSRPTYGIVPKSGRRNLLLFTEQFNNAYWAKTTFSSTFVTVTADQAAAPDGTNTADLVNYVTATDADGIIQRNFDATPSGKTYTGSVWVKGIAGQTINLILDRDGQTGAYSQVTMNGNWQRLSITYAYPAGSNAAIFRFGKRPLNLTAGTVTEVLVWGAQIELSAALTEYQRVGSTAFDVTEAGFESCHYLQFDGIDDGLSTSAIDFSGTNKMLLVAGVRKLSDATSGIVAELTNISINSGAFTIFAGNNTTIRRLAWSTAAGQHFIGSSGYIAPTNVVMSSIIDRAATTADTQMIPRVNGVVVDRSEQTFNDVGGNFANAQMFIGSRAGTSVYLNGQLFGLIARGAESTAAEIKQAEKLAAKKIIGIYDLDAEDYFARVVSLGGIFASSSYTDKYVRRAISDWFVICKDLNIYSKITEAYLFAGPTFDGFRAKLKHAGTASLSNANFVSGDYVQSGIVAGLKGDGSTKRLTGLVQMTRADNNSLSSYVTEADTLGDGSFRVLIGVSGTGRVFNIANNNGREIFRCGDSVNQETHQASFLANARTGFLCGTIRATNDRELFRNGASIATNSVNSVANVPNDLNIFRAANANVFWTNARIAFAHVGTDLTAADAANLSTATNALMTALGTNVY